MTQKEIREVLDPIAEAIREAGLVPYDQIYGYVQTGNPMYITRRNDAREKILKIDKGVIQEYLKLIDR